MKGYRVSQEIKEETIWNVEESNGSFNVRMTGHGSEDKYQENLDGEIVHLKQVNNWISSENNLTNVAVSS